MNKLVILVGCNQLPIYESFKEIWLKFHKLYEPYIKIYFIYGDESVSEISIDRDNNVITPIKDCLFPGIYQKLNSIEKYLLQTDPEWTHLMRCGVGSFLRLDLLLSYIKTLSITNTVSGYLTFNEFPSGCSVIITRDVIEQYAKEESIWKIVADTQFEDVTFGRFLKTKLDINIIPHRYRWITSLELAERHPLEFIVGWDFKSYNTYLWEELLNGNEEYFQFRIKSIEIPEKRLVDIELMDRLCKHYYEI